VRGSLVVDLPEDFGVDATLETTMEYDKVYRLGESIAVTLHATTVEDDYICGTYNTDLDDEGSFWLKPSN
jgi:hypothetical protein